MSSRQTDAGTPVLEMSREEYADFLNEEVQARMSMSAEEFEARYRAGDLDEADPDVSLLVGLLWIGQNGLKGRAATAGAYPEEKHGHR